MGEVRRGVIRQRAAAGKAHADRFHPGALGRLKARVGVFHHDAGGRVILDGPPRAVFAQGDALRACRLDLPPVVAMGEMLQKGGMKLPLCLEIEELADAIWQYS